MTLKSTASITAIIFLAIMQSCSVPNPYQPVNNASNNSTSPNNTSNSENDGNDENDNEGSNGTNSTGTTTGGTNTGTTTTGGTTLSGSSANANKSHNMGQNCMNCHNPGGSGKGVWQIGGTVYNQAGTTTNPNVVIKFYTGSNGTGTLKYTLNADAKGNLYTAGPVDFTGGLYPAVVGSTGTNYMSNPITNGACNSCHTGGTGTARIWTN